MKSNRVLALFTLVLLLAAALAQSALAASPCYPISVTRSEDGLEVRKVYELSPGEDPAGIPRSDFDQEGFHYTLADLLRQEAPEHEQRTHTETVTAESKSKDMASILALLPQTKEFVTEDGLSGTLSLQLDTVQVEVSGYGSTTRQVSATRTYPDLASQDTAYIPKTIQAEGRTLTLQDISWRTASTNTLDAYSMGERFTAVATYTGTASASYVKGYTVTADYTGTVSRIALNKVRYVAVFEGTPVLSPVPAETAPVLPEPEPIRFQWAYVLVPLGVIVAAGSGMGLALFLKRRHESEEEDAQ